MRIVIGIVILLLLVGCNDPARRQWFIATNTPTATYLPPSGTEMQLRQRPGEWVTADQSMITRWATYPTAEPTLPAQIVPTQTEAPTADLRAGTPPPTLWCVNFCNGEPLPPTQVQP